MVVWLLAMIAWSLVPAPESVAAMQGKDCPYGCVVGLDGYVYELNWHDVVSFAVALDCEVGGQLGEDEGRATAWALTQNFYRYHLVGKDRSFSGHVRSYSACANMDWSSIGTRYHPRITPRADRSLRKSWSNIRLGTRRFVSSFLLGMVSNRWPGFVYVFTHGWEERANGDWIGPFYVNEHGGRRSYNAYYKDGRTKRWIGWEVRIAQATTREARFLRPGETDADWPEE